jgi:hypothetical protein
MKRLLLLCLAVIACSITAHGQFLSPGFNRGPLTLNPGWTWLQDSVPLHISGGTVQDICVATASTCTFPVISTTAGSVWVALVGTSNNVTITATSGWTLCPSSACHNFDALGFNWDIAYSTSGSSGTTSITVNLSGAAGPTTGDLFYINFIELLPPAGFTGAYDTGGIVHSASCTTCSGVALTLTGTDAVIQATTGGDHTSFSQFSSPYFTEYISNAGNVTGVALNTTSGTAPTIVAQPSGPMDGAAIAFKSTAGTFTPPTPVFSLVNLASTVNDSEVWLNCSPTCSLTIPSTGTGHLLFVQVSDESGTNLSAITGGGTWVIPSGSNTCAKNNSGITTSCAYVLSSSSGATTLNMTMTGSSGNIGVMYYEVARTSGSFVLDAQNSTSITTVASPQSGQGLTLTGTNDVIFQEIASADANVPLAQSLYPQPLLKTSQAQVFANNNASTGVLLNSTNGAAPSYLTFATGDPAVVSAVAFK